MARHFLTVVLSALRSDRYRPRKKSYAKVADRSAIIAHALFLASKLHWWWWWWWWWLKDDTKTAPTCFRFCRFASISLITEGYTARTV